jgi:hypothetical protein
MTNASHTVKLSEHMSGHVIRGGRNSSSAYIYVGPAPAARVE